uniref:Uncharacterized protein n=1 Tax=Parascaris univalens TaxID=6257 RepID=A0A915APX1_PARUN
MTDEKGSTQKQLPPRNCYERRNQFKHEQDTKCVFYCLFL